MVGTILIHGSDEEVAAPLGTPGTFYPAKRGKAILAEDFSDPDLPLEVQQALRGRKVNILSFKKEILTKLGVPLDSVLAYASETKEDLEMAGKTTEAAMLGSITRELDMLVFTPGQFKLCDT